jgi:hypothetical protein
MDYVCITCGVFIWITERKSASSLSQPRFQTRCGDGKCILPPIKAIPELIAKLFRGSDTTSKDKEFRGKYSNLQFSNEFYICEYGS